MLDSADDSSGTEDSAAAEDSSAGDEDSWTGSVLDSVDDSSGTEDPAAAEDSAGGVLLSVLDSADDSCGADDSCIGSELLSAEDSSIYWPPANLSREGFLGRSVCEVQEVRIIAVHTRHINKRFFINIQLQSGLFFPS